MTFPHPFTTNTRRVVAVGILAGVSMVLAHAGEPPANAPAPSALEIRANDALGSGKYGEALLLYQKVQASLKADPKTPADKLGAIDEQIRVCQKNLASKLGPAANAQPAAAAPAANEPRKPHALPKAGEVPEMGIKDLGNFDYDATKGGNIPQDVKALGGHKIRTRGFMLPLDQAENISEFALVPSLFGCCSFGQPPQIQHTIVVHTPKGKSVAYYPDEIIVEGNLKVDEKKDDGYIVSVFEMDATSVKPAAK